MSALFDRQKADCFRYAYILAQILYSGFKHIFFSKIDLSRKGSIDDPIVEIIKYLNSHQVFNIKQTINIFLRLFLNLIYIYV